MFVQYEVWGIRDQHEDLIECVPTLKEALEIVDTELEFWDEVYILEDKNGDLDEIRRYKNTNPIE